MEKGDSRDASREQLDKFMHDMIHELYYYDSRLFLEIHFEASRCLSGEQNCDR
jgi:hypothetical protein